VVTLQKDGHEIRLRRLAVAVVMANNLMFAIVWNEKESENHFANGLNSEEGF